MFYVCLFLVFVMLCTGFLCVALAVLGLAHKELPASISLNGVLGLKVCTTATWPGICIYLCLHKTLVSCHSQGDSEAGYNAYFHGKARCYGPAHTPLSFTVPILLILWTQRKGTTHSSCLLLTYFIFKRCINKHLSVCDLVTKKC